MNANEFPENDLILQDEVYLLVGSALEVLNVLGHGLREKTYERAMIVELKSRSIQVEQQKSFPVFYKGVEIDTFIPDLIAMARIVIDTKTIERITDLEIGQMLNYLKITGLSVGLILNFKRPKLEWRRVVLQTHKKDKNSRPFPSIRGSNPV
ncbi:MAG: GxxExxY protein [Verrucomicrobiae bacterium]|nr:GxxExxY protein [Verrucomicrobiae bacterium]